MEQQTITKLKDEQVAILDNLCPKCGFEMIPRIFNGTLNAKNRRIQIIQCKVCKFYIMKKNLSHSKF